MSTEIETYLADLFAKNRALYGDLRMEVTEEEQKTTEEPPKEGAEAPAEGSEEKVEEKGKDEQKDGSEALPEWAKKELSDVRAEAANYRTKLREAEAKLSSAKTPEEVQAAISDLQVQNAKLERELLVGKVAGKHGLPSELADVLKGDDEAALEAHAKVLAKFAATPTPPGDLEGGLNPSDDKDGDGNDPRKLAARFRRI